MNNKLLQLFGPAKTPTPDGNLDSKKAADTAGGAQGRKKKGGKKNQGKKEAESAEKKQKRTIFSEDSNENSDESEMGDQEKKLFFPEVDEQEKDSEDEDEVADLEMQPANKSFDSPDKKAGKLDLGGKPLLGGLVSQPPPVSTKLFDLKANTLSIATSSRTGTIGLTGKVNKVRLQNFINENLSDVDDKVKDLLNNIKQVKKLMAQAE